VYVRSAIIMTDLVVIKRIWQGPNKQMAGNWRSTAGAAKILGGHPMSIFRMLRRGDIEAVKVGTRWRIPQAAIDKYLAERTNGANVARDPARRRIQIAHTDVPILLELVEAGFRAQAEEYRPDVGGNEERIRLLNSVIAGVRQQLAMIGAPQ
jgi:excisionase family DNA binding protein